MKKTTNGILTLLLAFFVQLSFAQERTISGTVSDEDGPLPEVSILIKGTTKGVVSDFDGNYSISAKTGDVLQFNSVGYADVEKNVGVSNTINVVMKADGAIDDVIISTAYDIKRTKPTTNTSVISINSETIENKPNASIVQTLQGQVSGLNISTGTGQPGADSEVIIRGVGSASGNSEPLFIIDGIAVDGDNFRSINPNEIASVTVLKDAGATSIYGNRGANGVILMKTKKGKFNSPLKITYSGSTALSILQGNKYSLMDSKQQLELERLYGAGRGANMTDAEIAAVSKYANTNWLDVFFREGVTSNHTLSLMSGGENVSNSTTFGFSNVQGILRNSGLQRFNLRTNIDGKTKNEKFNFGTTISLNFSKNDIPASIGTGGVNQNPVLGANASLPYISPFDYTPGEGGSIVPVFSNTPLLIMDKLATSTRDENEIKFLGSVFAGVKLNNNFKLNTRFTSDFTEKQLTRSQRPDSFNAVFFAQSGNNTPGNQSQQMTRTITFDFLNSLNFDKTYNDKHNLTAGAYIEYYKAHLRAFGYTQEGLIAATFYPGDGSGFVPDNSSNDFFSDSVNASVNNAGLFSYFGTLDYDYNKKYGFGATLRRDASYRFRSSNRWGTFYSVSARWNIDKEKFMEGSVFNLLKLRASHGTAGNQNITNTGGQFADFGGGSLTLDLYSTGSGYQGASALTPTQIANPALKWETVTQSNIGLDFEVFNKRLRGSVDFYKKVTTDLYQFELLPTYSGTAGQFVNSDGELENKGIDLELKYDLLKREEGVNISLNFNGNYNKSSRFGANNPNIREGGRFGEYYDYRYAGVNPSNGNLLFLDINGNLTESPNEDTDRVFLDKTRYGDYKGGFGFDVDYKNFYLGTQFNYIIGSYRYDGDYSGFIDPTAIGQFRHSTDILNAWTPTNTITDIPSLTATNLNFTGTRFLFDSDYLRLRSLTLGYNLPKKILKKTFITKFKTFFIAENILTLSGWRGFDAESSFTSSQYDYPTPRTFSIGVEIGL